MAVAAAAASTRNVLGTALKVCGTDPVTGYFRDGFCRTDASDAGVHVVAAVVDKAFLEYTAARGNDLSTPRGGFPGLKPGDRWCLCALRWKEAYEAGVAPLVDLEATHSAALRYVSMEQLESRAAPRANASEVGVLPKQ